MVLPAKIGCDQTIFPVGVFPVEHEIEETIDGIVVIICELGGIELVRLPDCELLIGMGGSREITTGIEILVQYEIPWFVTTVDIFGGVEARQTTCRSGRDYCTLGRIRFPPRIRRSRLLPPRNLV